MVLKHPRVCTAMALSLWLALSPPPAGAQDSIAAAKKLYQSADYDAALGMLERLKADTAASADPELSPYRVLCLLALGRSDEAQQSIAAILREDPGYRPSETEMSPRVRAVFEDARRRLLPQIFQDQYGAAKAAFGRKEFQSAADQFQSLAVLLDDPALPADGTRADLRTVVSAFADLAQAAATAAVPPAAPSPLAAPPPIDLAAALPPARVYVGGTGVVPPVAISRPLPQLPRSTATLWRDQIAILDVLINEEGGVAEIVVKKSIHAQFDKQLIDAVRTWRFRPATRDGQPVSFRQVFELKLAP
jgi:TonB family protein